MRYTLLHAMDELSACRPESCWPAFHRPAAMSCYFHRIAEEVPLTPQTGSSYLPALRDATALSRATKPALQCFRVQVIP